MRENGYNWAHDLWSFLEEQMAQSPSRKGYDSRTIKCTNDENEDSLDLGTE